MSGVKENDDEEPRVYNCTLGHVPMDKMGGKGMGTWVVISNVQWKSTTTIYH